MGLVSDSEEEEYVDPDTFASEMELALANVRKLASYQQEEFVTKISDLYSLYNGKEPSVSELDEDIEQAEKEEKDDSDSDYDPKDEADLKQVKEDEEEDYSSEE